MMECPVPTEYIIEIGPLYGRSIIKTKDYFCSISFGVSIIKGVKRGNFLRNKGYEINYYEKLTFCEIGIPLEMQLFMISPYLGIGLDIFGNLNRERSYGGFLFCFQVGKLQRHD